MRRRVGREGGRGGEGKGRGGEGRGERDFPPFIFSLVFIVVLLKVINGFLLVTGIHSQCQNNFTYL